MRRFIERARKRFLQKQHELLEEAKTVSAATREVGGAPAEASTEMVVEPLDGASSPTPPPSPHEGGAIPPAASKSSQVIPVDSDEYIAEIVKNEQSRIAAESDAKKEAKPMCKLPDASTVKAIFMALLPCLVFIAACFVLAVIENVTFDCYNTALYPTHASIVASDNCWTMVDAFYFSIITLSTIGYGDVTPSSKGGKVIVVFLIPLAIISLTNFIGKMADMKAQKKMGLNKTLKEKLEELNTVIEQDDNGIVTPEEYILFNLKQMGKVDNDTVNLLREQFNALDADGSGELDANDLALLRKSCDMIQKAADKGPASRVG